MTQATKDATARAKLVPEDTGTCQSIWENCTPSGYGPAGRLVAQIVGDDAIAERYLFEICEAYNSYDRLRTIEEVAGEMARRLDDYVSKKASRYYSEGRTEDFVKANTAKDRALLAKCRDLLNTEEQK